jgi:hypothetical protein
VEKNKILALPAIENFLFFIHLNADVFHKDKRQADAWFAAPSANCGCASTEP